MTRSPENPSVQLLIPVFNESEILPELARRLEALLSLSTSAGVRYSALLIDDGSSDGTGEALEVLSARDRRFGFLRLSRNFGHQAAITAGLDHADGDAVVVLDGDLQDPPELVPEMVALWRQGKADVVYGVRKTRREVWIKRVCYAAFYRLFNLLTRMPIPLDAGDFGLMSRRVYTAVRGLPERVKFLRGLRFWVGFRQVPLEYDRRERHAGASKYDFSLLYKLATDGLIGFSSLPLRVAQFSAFLMGVATLGVLAAHLMGRFHDAASLAALMSVVLCVALTLMFLCLYALSAYVERIHEESKGRPLYVVSEFRPPQPPVL